MITLEFLRLFRISGYALFDLAISFVGIYVLAPILSYLFHRIRLDIPKKSWLLLTLPIGIAAHLLIGQKTLMTKNFVDPQGHFVLKLFILIVLYFGLRDIKIVKKVDIRQDSTIGI